MLSEQAGAIITILVVAFLALAQAGGSQGTPTPAAATIYSELEFALARLSTNPQADVTQTEALYLYPMLERSRTMGAHMRVNLTRYVVARDILQPAPDFHYRLLALRFPDQPGLILGADGRRLQNIIDGLLLGEIGKPQALALLEQLRADF